MLKQMGWSSLLILTVASVPAVSQSLTVQDVPNPRRTYGGWVTDAANMLSPETETKINSLISQLEAQNGTELAVVTVPQTQPQKTPKAFATALFNYWGIGKKGQNNGVLLLISQGDRRVEIETGYGVESILPDARVSNIIQQEITPRFKTGDFNGGTMAGTQALVVALKAYQPQIVSADRNSLVEIVGFVVIGGIIFLVVLAILRSLVRWFNRPVLMEPTGRSRSSNLWGCSQNVACSVCSQPMQKLDSTVVLPYLSQAEQVAQNLGSVKFEGWQCSNCYPHLTGSGIHIRGYITVFNRFSNCPTCQELTVERSDRILQSATTHSQGIRQVTQRCHCCSYSWETEETIPCVSPPPVTTQTMSASTSTACTSSTESYNGWSSGTSSDTSSSSWSSDVSSYSSDCSSSDFGGGSSGGGGSGGDW